MARPKPKTRVYVYALMLLSVVGVVVWISVFASRSRCPHGSFSKAAVAADSEICSQIGRDMLQKGGSAVDGAIAALLCTSLVNPQSMGIGGGAIFTVMDSSGNVKIISSRESVPQKLKPDLLKICPKKFRFLSGPEFIGVPGEIRGYELAHKLYGKLPWATLFQPAIKLAREGLQLTPVTEKYIPAINKNFSLYKLFSDANGNPRKTGDIVKFEKLADTLELIANHGPEAFYSGKIAQDLISDIQEAGGTLTLQDLASFRASQSDPLVFPFQEFEVYIPPPPAGGAILALVLNILKGYNWDAKSFKLEEKTLAYHRYIEAFKFVNGLKKHMQDPNTSDKIARTFIQDSFADHIRTLISDRTFEDQYYNLTSYLDSMGTTHMSVLAEDGSAVSVTSTINHIFGSQILSTKTGIILNNQIADFCGTTEEIHAGEHPPSSASPAVLKSQSRTLVIGASGGSMIVTGIASTLMNRLWFGKSLKDAVASPVVFVNSANQPIFEGEFDQV
ncbi:gamma-glutamyltransferase 5a isoform X2 [Boleophthalmus pectinirostris]|uniref:gamma-glutamyltransferase 5a isoform X2 n=1 Tax=Boleophthalmus pectinirostris TaxID=150288 RepID=UPI000A1C4A7C|nr:gamma-glutamyltransferase 5a isoform X2 [Boleophthalmus pectinirostris]